MANTDNEGPRGGLSEDAKELYGRIARGEQTGRSDSEAERELWRWDLVTADPERPDRLVALEPKAPMRRHVKEQAEEIARRAAELAGVPDMAMQLSMHYERARHSPGDACEYVDDPAQVNARIQVAIANAKTELRTAQPRGPRTQELFDIAAERDGRALERGVKMRTLYNDSVRDDEFTRRWATLMTSRGAQIRTMVAPFERCVIVDRSEAFMSNYVIDGAPPHAAWHVRDEAFVGFMVKIFDETWRRADPWAGDVRAVGHGVGVGAGPRTTRRQREILRDLCEGQSQEAIAKRLGWSPRAVARELEKLRTLSGARSTYELVYLWALCPDRLIDDQPADVTRDRVERAA